MLILAKKLPNGKFEYLGTVTLYDKPFDHIRVDKNILNEKFVEVKNEKTTISPDNKTKTKDR